MRPIGRVPPAQRERAKDEAAPNELPYLLTFYTDGAVSPDLISCQRRRPACLDGLWVLEARG